MNASRWLTYLEFPLLRREFVGLLRTKTAFFVLLGCVLLTALLPLLRWPTDGSGGYAWYRNIAVFQLFFGTQLVTALLAVPAFTAGAISGERERGTYDLLYTTLLPPWSIIVSKTLASTGYVLILLAALAPLVCAMYLLGGLAFDAILRAYAVTFAAVIMSGLACLAQSMRCRRTAQAAVRGMFRVVFFNGALLLLVYLVLAILDATDVLSWSSEQAQTAAGLALCTCPNAVVAVEILGATTSLQFLPSWAQPWTLFLLYAALVSSIYLVLLLRAVRTPDMRPSWLRKAARIGGKKPKKRKVLRSWSARMLLRAGNTPGGFLSNPVFSKELQSEFFAQPKSRRFLFWGPLVVWGVLAFAAPGWTNDCDSVILPVCTVTILLAALLVPAYCASTFTREIEQGNLDFLRGTLLSMQGILRGKLLAGLYATGGIVASSILVVAGALAIGSFMTRGIDDPSSLLLQAGSSQLIVILTWLTLTLVSLCASVVSRRTVQAMVLSYGLLLAMYLILPVLLAATMGSYLQGSSLLAPATHPVAALTFPLYARPGRWIGSLLAFLVTHGFICIFLWLISLRFLQVRRARDP